MSQDPVQSDPKHYRVEYENDRIRVLRIKYGPHEKSVSHTHPESAAIVLTEGRVKFTFPDGRTREAAVQPGEFHWHPAGEHLPENLTDQPLEVLMIELKPPR